MAQLSKDATKALADFIEAEARAWVAQYIEQRKAVLAKRGILATGGLRDSFAFGMTKSVTEAITNSLELSFSEYGRFVEMKNLNVPRGGSEFIDALAAWIVRKGLEAKMTSDFVRMRNLRQPPPNVLNYLAWSIAIKRNQRFRRRTWYAKSKSAAVTDLFNRVAAGVPDIVMDEIKKSLTK